MVACCCLHVRLVQPFRRPHVLVEVPSCCHVRREDWEAMVWRIHVRASQVGVVVWRVEPSVVMRPELVRMPQSLVLLELLLLLGHGSSSRHGMVWVRRVAGSKGVLVLLLLTVDVVLQVRFGRASMHHHGVVPSSLLHLSPVLLCTG